LLLLDPEVISFKIQSGEAYNAANPKQLFSINSLAKTISKKIFNTKIVYIKRKKNRYIY